MYEDVGSWYTLLEHVSKGLLPTEEALVFAARGQEVHGKGCWAMPLAMAQWLEGRYSVALALL